MQKSQKNGADFYDREAARHLRRSAEFARQGDKARDPEKRKKYHAEAQKHRDEAIVCIEKAKLLDA